MKKLLLLFAAIIMAVAVSAQQFTIKGVHGYPSNLNIGGSKSIDTISPPVFMTAQACVDTQYYYSIGTGYLTGNGTLSGQSITEASQGFDHTGAGVVLGCIASVNVVSGAGGSGSFTAKAYSVGATDFSPATAVGTSNAVSMGTLTAGGNLVPLTFSTNPTINGNLAISIAMPAGAGDTICVLQTRAGCVDAAKDEYAYINIAGTWMSYKSVMQLISMGSFDMFMFAVVNTTGEVKRNPIAAAMNLYPNPANEQVTIASLNNMENIRLINCLGQVILDNTANTILYDLNTSGLDDGIYFIQIKTERGTVTKKLTIAR